MYAFEPRLPVDHVLAGIRLVRSDDFSVPELLKLIGAATGEVGALMAQGPIFSLTEVPDDIDNAIAIVETLEFNASLADPQFDITPYLPYILKLIEWLWKRRQG